MRRRGGRDGRDGAPEHARAASATAAGARKPPPAGVPRRERPAAGTRDQRPQPRRVPRRRRRAPALHQRSAARKARKSSSRSPRSRWAKRARASLRTSPCPAASWSTCRPSTTSASRARFRRDEERLRLKRVLQRNRTGIPGGYIVRTAGEGRTEEELARRHDVPLQPLAGHAPEGRDASPRPLLIHHDLDLVQRILRDQLTADVQEHLGGQRRASTRACCASCSASSPRWWAG